MTVGPTSASYKIDLGVLSANTWYEFQTLFSNTTYSWEAWRGGIPRHQIFLGEDFKKGNYVSCGLETDYRIIFPIVLYFLHRNQV